MAASNQAGKFVAEEPYEWYKSGLSEDGAINLEAPRKWRLLRERTGHGAFHGMRIIIYGDCIAPRLVCLLCPQISCLYSSLMQIAKLNTYVFQFLFHLVENIVVWNLSKLRRE